jgi:hypothetical protein
MKQKTRDSLKRDEKEQQQKIPFPLPPDSLHQSEH